ncbi:MAG: TonB-dependent receptor [Gemmatimonadota bacterium]
MILPEAPSRIPCAGRARAALVALALAAGAAGRAAAQVPDSTRQEAPAKQDTTTAVALPEIEVTSSIVPAAGPSIGSGVPARISIISGDVIDLWEPRILPNALGTEPGFTFYDDLGSAYKTSLTTRGFSAGPVLGTPQGVSVFVDGVRQNQPDAAEVNFDLLPLDHVKRVEFLHGTGSLLGPNSLGGSVNLITERGSGLPHGEIELSGGSYGLVSGEASVAGATGRWDYYLGAGGERDGGWREGTGARNGNVFTNVGRRWQGGGLVFQGFYAGSRAETAGSLPELLFNTDPSGNFTTGDFENINELQLSLAGHQALGPGRLEFRSYFQRNSAERFNVNQAPDPDVRSRSTNRSVGGTVDYRWERMFGQTKLALRAGVDGVVNRVTVGIFTEAPGDTTQTTSIKSPSWDLSEFAIADLTVSRVTLSAGARYDYIRIPFQDLLDPAADTTSTFKRLSPRGGVSVDLGGGASAYASVGQSFRAPALLELSCADPAAPCPLPFALSDDPPLKPVVATTVEAGGRWVVGPAILDLSAYRTAVRDDIYFIASDAALFSGYFANIGNTRREGIELGTRFIFDRFSVYANYAYTRATFRTRAQIFTPREDADPTDPLFGLNEVTPGDRLPLVPDHTVRFGGQVQLPKGLEAGLDARFTGPQWLRGDEANQTSRLPSYFTTDVRLGWTWANWQVEGIVANVFDRKYATFGTFNENRQTGQVERFLTPGMPRHLKLIIRRSFGRET